MKTVLLLLMVLLCGCYGTKPVKTNANDKYPVEKSFTAERKNASFQLAQKYINALNTSLETGDFSHIKKELPSKGTSPGARKIFENLKKGLKSLQPQSQLLMLPFEFMLTSDEVATINTYRDEIEKIGFKFSAEKYTVSVTAVPDSIELSAVQDMFITIADRIRNETGSVGLTRDIMFEKALYQASCKAAIKAGREYGEEHIKWLVDKMMELPDITFCPHGRPVAMEMKKASIDRQFKRT